MTNLRATDNMTTCSTAQDVVGLLAINEYRLWMVEPRSMCSAPWPWLAESGGLHIGRDNLVPPYVKGALALAGRIRWGFT